MLVDLLHFAIGRVVFFAFSLIERCQFITGFVISSSMRAVLAALDALNAAILSLIVLAIGFAFGMTFFGCPVTPGGVGRSQSLIMMPDAAIKGLSIDLI